METPKPEPEPEPDESLSTMLDRIYESHLELGWQCTIWEIVPDLFLMSVLDQDCRLMQESLTRERILLWHEELEEMLRDDPGLDLGFAMNETQPDEEMCANDLRQFIKERMHDRQAG